MRLGIRLQLVLALAGLFVLAFVPLFIAVSNLTRQTLRAEREANARAMGRVVAARIADARVNRSADDLAPLLDAQLALPSGLIGLALYDEQGRLLSRAGGEDSAPLLPLAVRPAEEAVTRVASRHGPALLVQVPGQRGVVLAALRIDDDIGRGKALTRLVGLYTLSMAAALLLFVYFALTRLVVRPIDDLSRSASSVLSGSRRLDPPSAGSAELLALGQSVASMTHQLLANEEALRSKIDALEQATSELKTAQAHLVRSERLASVGRLSAGLAHEVGNPLAALMGLQDLLLDGGLTPEEERDFLERMRKETERIHRILRDLLDFARPGARGLEAPAGEGNLREAVDEVLKLLRPQKKMREVRVEVSLPEQLPPLALGHEHLTQILLNLVDNAADATDGKGSVSIEAAPDGDGVLLTIRDDGPGIDPAILPNLFEPFVTTKPVGEGTGLGLAVCRGLIEAAGGSIAADPQGPGACFVIRLPAARGG